MNKKIFGITIFIAIVAILAQFALYGLGIWVIVKLLQHFGII